MPQKKFRKLKMTKKAGRKIKAYQKKKGKAAKNKNLQIMLTIVVLAFAVVVFGKASKTLFFSSDEQKYARRETETGKENYQILPAEDGPCGRPEIIQDFIVKNPYSRSGIAIDSIKGVVVHYVGNAGSTAEGNRDYFEGLKDTHLTKASSHFIIGLEGEIIQCIPLDEISYASNNRNSDTISIECCHPKNNGKFNKKTYASLVKLTAWLCHTYGLQAKDVIRHYDVTGKMCPKYFVKHEGAWESFLEDIQRKLAKIID